ncbi:N-acetylneuraminate synthase family protein [Helicobacter kayseriensis]|uniref:N-acetylneuraminate synthase family protein n=1 Tax=Helicobacter kayseriensis TaxID=2905877 RepID=UPI001E48C569|nr:N-acetylneuraminate synthase family protein [Helicobacter kayseriensis]MCE3046667.1 N-acetylneuraminate synthase family protein [Helicobacter kayseriensis]MCE3048031.1 N-acetylneuraminate synthase family protein [Helicobacter kayseriensis]
MDLTSLKEPYIIAEIGCNHNGDIDLAIEMINQAKRCGANAVKFQFFDEKLCTNKYLDELDKGIVKLENVDKWESKGLNLHNIRDQIRAFSNTKEEFQLLRDYCKKINIDFGCTAEDAYGVEVVSSLDSDFLKIASNDLNNPSTIQAAIQSQKPIIISTGMASLEEIDLAYSLFREANYKNFALLHCVSIYPPRNEIVNLNFINTLQSIYDCEIGYSDHTLGYSISLAAIAKGAKIIEKHFTLDKNMEGWDHKVSADPKDLEIICKEGKNIFECLGNRYKVVSQDELEKREKFRKSATSARDIKEGEIITDQDIVYRRPGTGITPVEAKWLIGRKARQDISEDTTLLWDYFV